MPSRNGANAKQSQASAHTEIFHNLAGDEALELIALAYGEVELFNVKLKELSLGRGPVSLLPETFLVGFKTGVFVARAYVELVKVALELVNSLGLALFGFCVGVEEVPTFAGLLITYSDDFTHACKVAAHE